MAEEIEEVDLDVELFTKDVKYAIPVREFTLPVSATEVHLNSIVKSFLKVNEVETDNLEFDFLLYGELMRTTLSEHLRMTDNSLETSLEIEYFLKFPAPLEERTLCHSDWVSAVRANKDWILTGCYDSTVQLWSRHNGAHKLMIPGHHSPVKSVAWIKSGDPYSTFVSTSHDETAMLWKWNQNTNSVDCINICKGHVRSVDCVDVCQERQLLVTGSYDKTLKLWSAEIEAADLEDYVLLVDKDETRKRQKIGPGTTKIKTPLRTMGGHNDGISGVQWTSANEVVTCSMDHTLRLWDVELGTQKAQINSSKSFLGISYSPSTRTVIAASAGNRVKLYDPRSQEGSHLKAVHTSHRLWITSVHWSAENAHQFVSGSHDMQVKLWDSRNAMCCLHSMDGHEDKVLSVDYSTRDIISGAADHNVKIFRIPVQGETSEMEY